MIQCNTITLFCSSCVSFRRTAMKDSKWRIKWSLAHKAIYWMMLWWTTWSDSCKFNLLSCFLIKNNVITLSWQTEQHKSIVFIWLCFILFWVPQMCYCPLGVPVCSECVSEQVEMHFYCLSSCFICILIYNLCMSFKLIAVLTKEK